LSKPLLVRALEVLNVGVGVSIIGSGIYAFYFQSYFNAPRTELPRAEVLSTPLPTQVPPTPVLRPTGSILNLKPDCAPSGDDCFIDVTFATGTLATGQEAWVVAMAHGNSKLYPSERSTRYADGTRKARVHVGPADSYDILLYVLQGQDLTNTIDYIKVRDIDKRWSLGMEKPEISEVVAERLDVQRWFPDPQASKVSPSPQPRPTRAR